LPRAGVLKFHLGCICECNPDGSNGQLLLPAFGEASSGLNISIFASEAEAEQGLARSELLFVINISQISIAPLTGAKRRRSSSTPTPPIPTTIRNATAALLALAAILNTDLPPVSQTEPPPQPFQFVVHARYNPEQLTVLNIVPELICIVLIFSTVFRHGTLD
jgi:ABC-2 type transport system permease protein